MNTEGYNRFADEHDLVVLAIGMEPSVDKDSLPVDIVFAEANEALAEAGLNATKRSPNRLKL